MTPQGSLVRLRGMEKVFLRQRVRAGEQASVWVFSKTCVSESMCGSEYTESVFEWEHCMRVYRSGWECVCECALDQAAFQYKSCRFPVPSAIPRVKISICLSAVKAKPCRATKDSATYFYCSYPTQQRMYRTESNKTPGPLRDEPHAWRLQITPLHL